MVTEENGQTIVETLIVLPVIAFILVAAVELWGVLTIYQHAESIKYHTLSKMQVNGGLSAEEEQELVEKLIDIGADPETIQVTGSIIREVEQPVMWPGEVNLEIRFRPKHFDNFVARTLIGGSPGKPIDIRVKGSAISEKT